MQVSLETLSAKTLPKECDRQLVDTRMEPAADADTTKLVCPKSFRTIAEDASFVGLDGHSERVYIQTKECRPCVGLPTAGPGQSGPAAQEAL